jgi:hypothetical protein
MFSHLCNGLLASELQPCIAVEPVEILHAVVYHLFHRHLGRKRPILKAKATVIRICRPVGIASVLLWRGHRHCATLAKWLFHIEILFVQIYEYSTRQSHFSRNFPPSLKIIATFAGTPVSFCFRKLKSPAESRAAAQFVRLSCRVRANNLITCDKVEACRLAAINALNLLFRKR